MEATLIITFLLVTLLPGAVVGAIPEVPEPSHSENNGNVSHLATFWPFNPERDMVFYLYNANNSEKIIQLNNLTSLRVSGFRPDLPIRIFISGFFTGTRAARSFRNAYPDNSALNNMYVDWGRGAQTLIYAVAALVRVPKAGRTLARFVDFLVRGGGSYDMTYLIGHSLGAHIVGIAGKNTAQKVNTIFGLDPARPLFSLDQPNRRIARGDAKYVEIIHTSDTLGIFEPLGDTDFYVNGGKVQPACRGFLKEVCSHGFAPLPLKESVTNNEFWAVQCSLENIISHQCNSNNYVVRMGGEPSNGAATDPPSGTFYLQTNVKSPYALGKPANP